MPMKTKENQPYSINIDLSLQPVVGVITYSVLGNDGNPISGYNGLTVTPVVGAVNQVIVIPATVNTVATPLFENRTVQWSYNSLSGVVSGRDLYRVFKNIPFAVSEDNVRNLIGANQDELGDDQIDLTMAYAYIKTSITSVNIDTLAALGDYQSLKISRAIEAKAALDIIPSLQLAIAKSEDSGTNKYERFTNIDWMMLTRSLDSMIQEAINTVDLSIDNLTVTIFTIATRPTDVFTGATNG